MGFVGGSGRRSRSKMSCGAAGDTALSGESVTDVSWASSAVIEQPAAS